MLPKTQTSRVMILLHVNQTTSISPVLLKLRSGNPNFEKRSSPSLARIGHQRKVIHSKSWFNLSSVIFLKEIFLGIFSNLTWYHFEIVTTLASIIWQKSNGTMPMLLFNKKKTWSEKKIFYSLEYSMWKKLWNVLLEDDKLNWGFTWSSTGAELTLQIATDPLLRGSLPAAEKARRVQLHFHLLILFLVLL